MLTITSNNNNNNNNNIWTELKRNEERSCVNKNALSDVGTLPYVEIVGLTFCIFINFFIEGVAPNCINSKQDLVRLVKIH